MQARGEPAARWSTPANDAAGVAQAFVDDDGLEVGRVDLDAWGRAKPATRDPADLRFPGQTADTDVELHYNRARYYDPDTGRYISSDPIGLQGGFNAFAYAINPIGWIDPYGLAPIGSWNDFQSKFARKFKSRKEAGTGWSVYKQNARSCNEPAIGRLPDTKVAATMGHEVLNTPGWTPAVNDAWMQGGIDRDTKFYLASPVNRSTLIPASGPHKETIFKRELRQLGGAGYKRKGEYMVPP